MVWTSSTVSGGTFFRWTPPSTSDCARLRLTVSLKFWCGEKRSGNSLSTVTLDEMSPLGKGLIHHLLVNDSRAGTGLMAQDAGLARDQGACSSSALNNIVNGTSGISPEMAIRLTKAFGGTEETWLRMQLAYDLAPGNPKSSLLSRTGPRVRGNHAGLSGQGERGSS